MSSEHRCAASSGPLNTTSSSSSSTEQPPQRKCGVHRINDSHHGGKVHNVAKKKRSVDAVVEAYLDEHPAFLDDYVRRKVNRRQLEQWLFLPSPASSTSSQFCAASATTTQHSSDSNLLKTGALLSTCVRGQPGQRQRSRSFTPLRKLSATTFEVGGLATPILATTSDGQPSFLRTNAYATTPAIAAGVVSPAAASEAAASVHSRKDLLLRLLPDMLQAQDLRQMAEVLLKSTNLLMGQADRLDLLILNRPNSFEGTTYSLMGDQVSILDHSEVMRNPLLSSALTSSQILNVSQAEGLVLPGGQVSLALRNALLGPLCKAENETIGCLQLYNKKGGFSAEDEDLFRHLLSIVSLGLMNVQSQVEMRLEMARSEVFLELARTVFREPTRLEATMLTILTNFLSLIDCERCQISLCDPDRPGVFRRVFDLQREELAADLDAPYENRLPMKSDITGHVAITGQKVNATKEQLSADGSGSSIRSFLCAPIHDPDGRVVGVISLANKEIEEAPARVFTNSDQFTSNDERFVEAFTIFCGMAIRNAGDYQKAVVSEAKLQVAFEVMNYQATSTSEDTTNLASQPVPAASSINIDSFDFSYLSMDDNSTLTATIRIFIDLGLISRFSIDYTTLCRWLLTVKRNYRNETVQYHNWYHAFNVTQMMFCMLTKTRWSKAFPTTDSLGLIVACISHDLDHRGTNNSFQLKSNNPLAKLYTTSTLERHHLNQCLLILTLRGNGILDNLTKDEYVETLSVIERSILATDLALHFRDASALKAMARSVQKSRDKLMELIDDNPGNKHLLQAGMMTAADLGAATKPWDVHRFVSQLIAEEFWTQGDIEREEFNLDPQPMFDRSVALSTVQIDFLDTLCLPLYEDLANFSPELQPLQDGCLANRDKWATNEEEDKENRSNADQERARNL